MFAIEQSQISARPSTTLSCRHRQIFTRSASRHPLRHAALRAIDPDKLTDRDIPISQLEKELDEAIDREDYSAAAQLRDEVQKRRFDNRFAVEEANEKFYAAFQRGSLADMSTIWGKGDHVQCIHPGAACIAGRDAVIESWKYILSSGRLKIDIDDVRIFATETQGYVTCVEVMDGGDSQGRIIATNVFEKQNGKWKIVHHHGSPMLRMG